MRKVLSTVGDDPEPPPHPPHRRGADGAPALQLDAVFLGIDVERDILAHFSSPAAALGERTIADIPTIDRSLVSGSNFSLNVQGK